MKKKIIQFLIIITLFLVAFLRIRQEKSKALSKTKLAMGTFVTIEIQDRIPDKEAIIDSCFSLISKYENIFSKKIEESETNAFNSLDNKQFKMGKYFSQLITKSLEISELTGGTFDITIGKLMEEYDFNKNIVPQDSTIKTSLPHVNYKNLWINEGLLHSSDNKVKIDFGGIAKGFIIDQIVDYLNSKNIKNAIINAGGDLYLMERKDKKGWTVGIRHPRNAEEIFCEITLDNNAIVTSGDYEQFFIKNNKRIHHIINPKTGLPARNSISVTVIADKATIADALSTALFIMGPDKGIKLANSLSNVETMIIYEEDDSLTYNLSGNFNNLNLRFHSKDDTIP